MKISHLGIAVRDLESAEQLFSRLLGASEIHREEVADQQVRVASFMVGDSRIELTAPTSPDSPISAFLDKRGEGIHHVALEVDDVNSELTRLKQDGFRLIDEKARKGAHDMLIAFLHPKSTNGVLVEICQVASPQPGDETARVNAGGTEGHA